MLGQDFNAFIKEVENKLEADFKIDFSKKEVSVLKNTVKLSEEVGELCERVLSYIGSGRSEKLPRFKKEECVEFGDVLIVLALLAKNCGINLENVLENKMRVIKKTF